MGHTVILEFKTRAEAEAALAAIDNMAVSFWQAQGYTVDDSGLVGKNALTHEDAMDKAHTTTWDTVKESPNGTFYFTSLTGTPYYGGMDDLEAAFNFEEKEIPASWFTSTE